MPMIVALAHFINLVLLYVMYITVALYMLWLAVWAVRCVTLWNQARLGGVPVRFSELVEMKLSKVDPRVIMASRIQAAQAGLDISTDQLKLQYLSGGHVPAVVAGMIDADRAEVELTWDVACAVDLAGRDVGEVIQEAIDSDRKVIDLS